MDQGPYLIDTNVFVIDLRYPRDRHFGVNRRFLDAIKRERSGVTTTINLLELCGILSFNLNQRQLSTLWEQFPDRFGVDVLPTADFDAPVPKLGVGELFALLERRMSLGDGQFLLTARKHVAFATTLVTWDRDHFVDRFAGRVVTPAEISPDGRQPVVADAAAPRVAEHHGADGNSSR